MTAVACAAVPKLTVIVGGSFGAGNYGMCGRAYAPRFLFSWPNVPDQRDGRRAGRDGAVHGRRHRSRPDPATYDREGSPYFASARLWDDGVLDPRETRTVLGLCLHASGQAPVPETRFGVFRM